MRLKERIESNLAIWFLGTLVAGFLAGLGSYKAILEIAHLDVVSQNSYVRKDELEARYVDKSTFDVLKLENAQLKETLSQQAITGRTTLRTSLSALVMEGKNMQGKSGDELVSGFDAWVQKGMQVTTIVGDETWKLFNNQVYFGDVDLRKLKNPTEIEKEIQRRINKGVAILEGALLILSSSPK